MDCDGRLACGRPEHVDSLHCHECSTARWAGSRTTGSCRSWCWACGSPARSWPPRPACGERGAAVLPLARPPRPQRLGGTREPSDDSRHLTRVAVHDRCTVLHVVDVAVELGLEFPKADLPLRRTCDLVQLDGCWHGTGRRRMSRTPSPNGPDELFERSAGRRTDPAHHRWRWAGWGSLVSVLRCRQPDCRQPGHHLVSRWSSSASASGRRWASTGRPRSSGRRSDDRNSRPACCTRDRP